MESSESLIVLLLLSSIISLAILYFIIQSASKGPDIHEQLKITNRLLIELLRKNGVDQEAINKAVNPNWKTPTK